MAVGDDDRQPSRSPRLRSRSSALPVRSCLRDADIPVLFEDDEPIGVVMRRYVELTRSDPTFGETTGRRMPAYWAHCIEESTLPLLAQAVEDSAPALRAFALKRRQQADEALAFLALLSVPENTQKLADKLRACQGIDDFVWQNDGR